MNADPSPSIAPRNDRRESSAGIAGRGRSGDPICSSAVRAHAERGFGGLPLPWPSGHMRNGKMDNIRNDHQAHRRCLAFLIRWFREHEACRVVASSAAVTGAQWRGSQRVDSQTGQVRKKPRRPDAIFADRRSLCDRTTLAAALLFVASIWVFDFSVASTRLGVSSLRLNLGAWRR
jgi:hypothetical protein